MKKQMLPMPCGTGFARRNPRHHPVWLPFLFLVILSMPSASFADEGVLDQPPAATDASATGEDAVPETETKDVEGNGVAEAPGSVYLLNDQGIPGRSFRTDILFRELYRQAFLLSARHELGRRTRTESLGESPGEVGVSVYVAEFKRQEVTFRVAYRARDLVQETLLKTPRFSNLEYGFHVQTAEEASRTTMPGIWKAFGVGGDPLPRGDGTVPASIRDDLDSFTETRLYLGLRHLHALIESEGESTERLCALARGYADLGFLTRHFWSGFPDVLLARALLYARRAHALDPDAWEPRFTQVYVLALCDLNNEANRAAGGVERGIRRARDNAPPPPVWYRQAVGYALHDDAGILRAEGEPTARGVCLAAGATFWNTYNEIEYKRVMEAMEVAEAFYRGFDRILQTPLVAANHENSVLILRHVLDNTIPGLARAGNLPPSIQQEAAKEDGASILGSRSLVDACHKEAEMDTAELDYGVLGRLLDDISFIALFHRASFMAMMGGGVSHAQGLARATQGGVENHRHYPILAARVGMLTPDLKKRLDAIDMVDLSMQIDPLALRTFGTHRGAREVNRRIFGNRNHTGSAFNALLLGWENSPPRRMEEHLRVDERALSPMISLMEVAYEKHRKAIEESWFPRMQENPYFLEMYASNLFVRESRFVEALPLLQRAAELAPHIPKIQFKLASASLDMGEVEPAKDALHRVLEAPDVGLNHARARGRLADLHYAGGDFEAATPLIRKAARTHAGWALQQLARHHEIMGDNDKAKVYFQRLGRSRGGEYALWPWMLDLRHGEETAPAIEAQLLPHFQERHQHGEPWLSVFHYLRGDEDAFLETYRAGQSPPLNLALQVLHALTILKRGESEKAFALLDKTAAEGGDPRLPDWVAHLRADLESGEATSAAEWEARIQTIFDTHRGDTGTKNLPFMHFIPHATAYVLRNIQNRPEDALELEKEVLMQETEFNLSFVSTAAFLRLREAGIDPLPWLREEYPKWHAREMKRRREAAGRRDPALMPDVPTEVDGL